MAKLAQGEITESDFRTALASIVDGEDMQIWLATGAGHRVDTVFGVGTPQSSPPKLIDRIGNFYLLGKNVPPELGSEIHGLFSAYCQVHEAKAYSGPGRSIPRRNGPCVLHFPRRPRMTMHSYSRFNFG